MKDFKDRMARLGLCLVISDCPPYPGLMQASPRLYYVDIRAMRTYWSSMPTVTGMSKINAGHPIYTDAKAMRSVIGPLIDKRKGN